MPVGERYGWAAKGIGDLVGTRRRSQSQRWGDGTGRALPPVAGVCARVGLGERWIRPLPAWMATARPIEIAALRTPVPGDVPSGEGWWGFVSARGCHKAWSAPAGGRMARGRERRCAIGGRDRWDGAGCTCCGLIGVGAWMGRSVFLIRLFAVLRRLCGLGSSIDTCGGSFHKFVDRCGGELGYGSRGWTINYVQLCGAPIIATCRMGSRNDESIAVMMIRRGRKGMKGRLFEGAGWKSLGAGCFMVRDRPLLGGDAKMVTEIGRCSLSLCMMRTDGAPSAGSEGEEGSGSSRPGT